jgi:hypothetical protein
MYIALIKTPKTLTNTGFEKKLITREFLLWDLDKPIPSDEIQSKLDEILKQAD